MFEENFGWSSEAEAAARAIVHNSSHAAHLMRCDGSEVDPFGEELSK
jgi:hypothetical protein